MMEWILAAVFFWLFFKAVGLAVRLSWCLTKFVVSALFTVALPLVLICLFFASGLLILVPLGLIALALGLLKACL